MRIFAACALALVATLVCEQQAEAQVTISSFGRSGSFSLSFGNGGGVVFGGGGIPNTSYIRNRGNYGRGYYGGYNSYPSRNHRYSPNRYYSSPARRSPWGGYVNDSYSRNR